MSDTALTGSSAPPVITTEFIGPHEARDMLEQAAPNRRINDSLVVKYACAMLDGDWHNIGVPVIMDDRGRLTDGQHRLRAVIESETVQQFTVAHGVVAEPFATGSTPTSEAIKLENTTQIAERTAEQSAESHQRLANFAVRIDDLETQINMLLEVAQHGGERASSVDRRISR